MTKGKLYEHSDLLDKNTYMEGMHLDVILDEAKAEFKATTNETHSMEDHYDNMHEWFKKWFGSEGDKDD